MQNCALSGECPPGRPSGLRADVRDVSAKCPLYPTRPDPTHIDTHSCSNPHSYLWLPKTAWHESSPKYAHARSCHE